MVVFIEEHRVEEIDMTNGSQLSELVATLVSYREMLLDSGAETWDARLIAGDIAFMIADYKEQN